MLERITERNMTRPQQWTSTSATALRIGNEKKGHLQVAEFREETRHSGP
jgi:hypothetical protein